MRMSKALEVITRYGNGKKPIGKIHFHGLPPIGTEFTIDDVSYKVTAYKLSLQETDVEGLYKEDEYQVIAMRLGGVH